MRQIWGRSSWQPNELRPPSWEALPELLEGFGVPCWVVPSLIRDQQHVFSDPARVRAVAGEGHNLGKPARQAGTREFSDIHSDSSSRDSG